MQWTLPVLHMVSLPAALTDDRRLLAGLGIVAGALAVKQLLRWRARRARATRLANHTKIQLLPSERSPILCMSPATSTVTFFRGSLATAEKHLSDRVAAIVTANPWLGGVLAYDPESGELAAYYSPAASSRSLFVVHHGVTLSREGDSATSYAAMVLALAPVLCRTSDEAAGTGEPLFSVALLPDAAAPDRYAVVVSANHSLLDGHGFYALYNMLSTDTEVRALRPTRKQELPAKMVEAMGGEESMMAVCPPGFLARFVLGQLRSALFPQTRAIGFDISVEWLTAQKAAAAAGGEVAWVSTNDCVVSAFCNCLRPSGAMMAVNFRGKLEGCNDEDVGNYEDLITYHVGDYETPALLRKSVSGTPYRRAAEPSTAVLSNWQQLSELLAPRVNRCPFTELPLRQVTALLCLTLDLTAPATHSGDLRALALLPSTHSLLPSSSSALLLPSNSDGAQSIF